MFVRKVDDAVGATSVHLVNGIWGQLSVGLFADPLTGAKGIFLGGGPFQLIVQAISSIVLTVWAGLMTVAILFVINKIIKIRLDPEDELKGCDLSEHFQGESFAKSYEISSPQEHTAENDGSFDRYKPFHVNQAFETNKNFL